jgi:flagellin-like protein
MREHERFDDRAVTPVVGIVLLLAITVLLAGTMGAFVFGFSNEPAEAEQPAAVFEFEDDVQPGSSDTMTIKHVSGKPVLAGNLYVKIDDAACTGGGSPDGRYSVADDFDYPSDDMGAGETTQVGKELGPGGTTLCAGASNQLDLSDATVTVVWENSEGATGTYQRWDGE